MTNLPASHFQLLRLAWLRALEILPYEQGHKVSSYSHRHLWYTIPAGGPCPCKATEYCSHMALANHARLRDRADYREAWKADAIAVALKRYERERAPERRAALREFDREHPTTKKLFGAALRCEQIAGAEVI
jgi:hypothetical protein